MSMWKTLCRLITKKKILNVRNTLTEGLKPEGFLNVFSFFLNVSQRSPLDFWWYGYFNAEVGRFETLATLYFLLICDSLLDLILLGLANEVHWFGWMKYWIIMSLSSIEPWPWCRWLWIIRRVSKFDRARRSHWCSSRPRLAFTKATNRILCNRLRGSGLWQPYSCSLVLSFGFCCPKMWTQFESSYVMLINMGVGWSNLPSYYSLLLQHSITF